VDDIKMNLREMGWGGMDWVGLAQDKGSCEHANEPLSFKILSNCTVGDLSRRLQFLGVSQSVSQLCD
jgi:hypothetical protein